MDWVKSNLLASITILILSTAIGVVSWYVWKQDIEISTKMDRSDVLVLIAENNKDIDDRVTENEKDIAVIKSLILTMEGMNNTLNKIDERTFEQGKDIEKIKGRFNIN